MQREDVKRWLDGFVAVREIDLAHERAEPFDPERCLLDCLELSGIDPNALDRPPDRIDEAEQERIRAAWEKLRSHYLA